MITLKQLMDEYENERLFSLDQLKRISFRSECIALESITDLCVSKITEGHVVQAIRNEYIRFRENQKVTGEIRFTLKILSNVLEYYKEVHNPQFINPVPEAISLLKIKSTNFKKEKKIKQLIVAKKVKKTKKVVDIREAESVSAFEKKLAFAEKLSEALGRDGQALIALRHKNPKLFRLKKKSSDKVQLAADTKKEVGEYEELSLFPNDLFPM